MPGVSLSKNGHTNIVAKAEERLLGIFIIVLFKDVLPFHPVSSRPLGYVPCITNILKRARETIAGGMAHAPRTRDEKLEDAQRLAP